MVGRCLLCIRKKDAKRAENATADIENLARKRRNKEARLKAIAAGKIAFIGECQHHGKQDFRINRLGSSFCILCDRLRKRIERNR